MEQNHIASAEEAAIRQVVEGWANAVRQRNIPAILANHSEDMLMFDVPPPFESRGIDAYRKTWDLFFSSAPTPAVFDIKEMNVTAASEVAFVTAAMRCTTCERSGENVELDFRLTIGLRKIDGEWIITHEHHSVPATD